MAQETASITFTLEDDFSSKLDQIQEKLREFQQKLMEPSERGRKGFKDVGDSVEGVGQRLGGVEMRVNNLSTHMKNAFVDFAKSLASTQKEVGGLERGLISVAETATRALGPLRAILGPIAGIVGVVTGTTAAVYALGEHLADTFQAQENLRRELGETGDFFIDYVRRVGEHLGMTTEETDGVLNEFASKYFETVKGTASELYETFAAFGDEGEKVFRQLEQARQQGKGSAQAFHEILMPWLSVQPAEVQRRFAARLRIPLKMVQDYAEEARRTRKPWEPDPEMKEKWEDANRKLRAALKTLGDSLWDFFRQHLFPWQQSIVEKLGDVFTWINERLPGAIDKLKQSLDEFSKTDFVKQVSGEFGRFIREFNQISDDFKAWGRSIEAWLEPAMQFLEKWGLMSRGRAEMAPALSRMNWSIADVRAAVRRGKGAAPGEDPEYGNVERLRDMLTVQGRERYRERTSESKPFFSEQRGEAIQLQGRQFVEDQREGNTYLREIRDVMVWIREQQVTSGLGGPSSTGGGVFGGNVPGGPLGPRGAWAPGARGLGTGGRGGGGDGGGGGGDGAAAGPKVPTSPAEAPQTLKEARERGYMSGGGTGAVSDKILDAIQKQEGWHPGSISYSQNNPGNIKWGAFAKAHGATGPGRGGHAIFPDYATGRAALKALIQGKGGGKSLAEISQWYAEGPQGGMHWARGVAKFAGVDPSYVPAPRDGGTTQGGGFNVSDVRRAVTGSTTSDARDGGGPAAPSAILEQAKKMAALGGPAAVKAFMDRNGYPRNSQWCGDFAAMVVRRAGGTPPRNPELASNWRRFGQEVGAPQPGDIAVARPGWSRRGSGRTGDVGSHVTVVGDVQDGTFTGIGGNQSQTERRFNTRSFQFFRAAQDKVINVAAKQRAEGRANVDINIRTPKGTKARRSSDQFKNPKVTLAKSGQMGSAANMGTDDSNQYAEE